MKFLDNIKNDMYRSLKNKDKDKVRVLRSLLSKLKNKKINNGNTLNEKDFIGVLKTSIKQIEESIIIYENAKRFELVDKDKHELVVLKSYLPEMMSDHEIKTLVFKVVKDSGIKNINQIGKVMPKIMELGGTKIDGKKAVMILKEFLD